MKGWWLALLLAPGLAWPQHWACAPALSRLAFEARWEASPVPGEFREFSVRLETTVDGRTPQALEVVVAVASLATEMPDVDAALAEPDWLDFARFTEARYRADRIEPLGTGQFRADGELTLKGVRRTLPVAFSWGPGSEPAHLQGAVVLDRGMFGIGIGDWAAPEPIALEVRVIFDLAMYPQ